MNTLLMADGAFRRARTAVQTGGAIMKIWDGNRIGMPVRLLTTYNKVVYPPFFRYASTYVLLFAVAAGFAFWPRYLAKLPQGGIDFPHHLHAVAMTTWLAMLIAQPFLAMSGRLAWHRRIGVASYFVVPLVLISPMIIEHMHVRPLDLAQIRTEGQSIYLMPAMVTFFAAAYGLALANRRSPAVHGFYMLCTSLAFMDPTLSRLYTWYLDVHIEWLRQPDRHPYVNFLLADLIILAVLVFSDTRPTLRLAAAKMLAISIAIQIPYFTFAKSELWFTIIRWFRDLPLP